MHLISEFLRGARPNLFCKGYLALSLGIPVRRETDRLIEADGVKTLRGACTMGGAKTVVTAA